jgi:hypothetical protein
MQQICTRMTPLLVQRATLLAADALRAGLTRPLQVSSTETGVIFGNIVYEGSGYAERSVVVLNDIHIDIMDYISPAVCADVQFRNMWAEFEWENKVGRGVMLVVGGGWW